MSLILGQKRYGLIFDLDNTILPTASCYTHALSSVRKLLSESYNLTTHEANSIVDKYCNLSSIEKPFHSQNKLSVWEWREELFKEALLEYISAEKVDVSLMHKHFEENFLKGMVISKESKSLLLELRKRFKLAILTNGDSKHQRTKLKNCQAEKYFDAIIVSGEHTIYKPDPRIFHIACRKIGLESRQCIMIGDLLGTDIIGSQNAGFKGSILIKGKDIERLDQIQPDHVISNLNELLELLDTYEFT